MNDDSHATANVENVLDAIGSAIKKGEFEQAAIIGNSFQPPLGIPSSDLGRKELIFSGQQGTVHRGSWKGQDVAIKRAKISSSADTQRLRSQVRQLLVLGQNDKICPLIAARLLPPDHLLIHPLYQASLADNLNRQASNLNWRQITEYGLQIAQGLTYTHNCGIMHRDVKPDNVLIDEVGDLHLSDFGISVFEDELRQEMMDKESLVGRHQPSGGFHKRHMIGTLEYLAPEVLLKQPYSFPIDIFAWAVTINEVATRIPPYSDCTKENPAAHTVLNFGYGRQELAAAIVSEGLRPLMRPDTPSALASLIEQCWHLDPQARPTAESLVTQLQSLLSEIGEVSEPSTLPSPQVLEDMRKRSAQGTTKNGDRADKDSKPSRKVQYPYRGDLSQPPGWTQRAESVKSPKVVAGMFNTAGSRGEDRMEDRHLLVSPIHSQAKDTHCFAVFDGHRGSEAAQYACNHMLQHLEDHWLAPTPEEALQCTFQELDRSFLDEQATTLEGNAVSKKRKWPGCTAILGLLSGSYLWIANAGDCRAVLCRNSKALQLNREHSTEDNSERDRVSKMGGKLQQVDGSWRLGSAGIQVTRSIGDGDLKSSGLSSVPEVTQFELGIEDTFLILASDGLWDKLSSQDAIDLVHDTVKDATMCAQRLATEALTRGSGDNITVIVVFLQPVATLEAIFQGGQHTHRAGKTFYGTR